MAMFGGGLKALLDPGTALPVAAALMGGQGNQANFANALGALGPAMQQNRTLNFLRQQYPDLAAQVDAGLPLGEAFRMVQEERRLKAQGPSYINAGDGNLFNETTGEWIQAPNQKAKAPQVVELFDEASGQPYKATWNEQTGAYERVGGIKARSGMSLQTNPDGTVTLQQGDMGKAPKLTEAEGRNAGFYGRGAKAHQVISGLEEQGTSLWNKTMQAIPGGLGNYGLDAKAQQYDQAQRDFINAVLRRESGAVISPEEFDNAKKQYFPQPGDTPEVIAQKRVNRETTIRGLEVSSGQGAAMATQPPNLPGAPAAQTPEGWVDLGNGVRIRPISQ